MLSALPSLATGERTFRIGRFVPIRDITQARRLPRNVRATARV